MSQAAWGKAARFRAPSPERNGSPKHRVIVAMLPKWIRRAGLPAAGALALAACDSSPGQQDRQNVEKARSLLAEWAMLADQHRRGRLTETYYAQMRTEAETALSELASTAPKSGSADGQAIGAIAQLHGDPPAELLQARTAAAEALENRLEAR